MSAVWMRVRAELRAGRRASVGLALLVAVAGGVVLAAAAGARRTDTAYVFPLRYAAGADPDVAHKDITDELGFIATAFGSVRPADIENLAQVRGAPVALAGLLGVVGAAALIHAVTSSVRRRRRDLAILKTIGFVRRQVPATVAWQATAMAAAALLVGLPLGVAAGRWIWSAYADRIGVLPDPRVALVPIALAIPATIVLANLIAALPGRAAARTPPAAVLRTE